MRIAVLGRTHWLLKSARTLMDRGHRIAMVATAAPAPEYQAGEREFEELAKEASAPFYLAPDVNSESFRREVRSARPDIAISVNWPTMIREETCASLRFGILNGHAGDLPRYRGNACPNWAILNNESRIGLCVHAMDPTEIDAGPIYARRYLSLDDDVYIGDVYRWIEGVLPDMFKEAVDRAADPRFFPEDQSKSPVRPLRCHPRRPTDGNVDWSKSADDICRLVRASSRPLQGAYSYLEGRARATIWRACRAVLDLDVAAVPGQIMGRGPSGGCLVACGVGAIEIEEAVLETGDSLPCSNRFRLARSTT